MESLIEHAFALGLQVAFDDLGARHAQLEDGVVVVNERRSYLLQRAALAHECGHHVRGHCHFDRPTGLYLRYERQADDYAARLLIADDAYAVAERIVGPEPDALARELGVPVRLIQAWRRGRLGRVG